MEKYQFYSEVKGFYNEQIDRGKKWKAGWIAITYKQKFGTWPTKEMGQIQPKEPSKNTRTYIKFLQIKNAKSRKKMRA